MGTLESRFLCRFVVLENYIIDLDFVVGCICRGYTATLNLDRLHGLLKRSQDLFHNLIAYQCHLLLITKFTDRILIRANIDSKLISRFASCWLFTTHICSNCVSLRFLDFPLSLHRWVTSIKRLDWASFLDYFTWLHFFKLHDWLCCR